MQHCRIQAHAIAALLSSLKTIQCSDLSFWPQHCASFPSLHKLHFTFLSPNLFLNHSKPWITHYCW